jgi:hypothetical protein
LWNHFYGSWVQTTFRFVGAYFVVALVLVVGSGLAGRCLIPPRAVVWPRPVQRFAQAIGLVLLVTVPALPPVYIMFRGIVEDDVGSWLSPGMIAVYGVSVLFAMTWLAAHVLGLSRAKKARLPSPPGRFDFLRQWWRPMAALAVGWLTAFLVWQFADTGSGDKFRRPVIGYDLLALITIVIVATAFGQLPRLQVEVIREGGGTDEPATRYLLSRLRTLGKEQSPDSSPARSAGTFSQLQQQDLSGVPGGPVGGALAKLLFALRPDLAWQAKVSLVDDHRIAMQLSRLGRLYAADVFSRSDLGLRTGNLEGPADQQLRIDQAHAQMLTGAAAFILLELGKTDPRVNEPLCGARDWRSVALQVIAASASLAEHEEKSALLRLALKIDPDNGMARYEYIRDRESALKGIPHYRVHVVEMYENLLEKNILDGVQPPKQGWEVLYLRTLYRLSIAWLDICVVARRRPGAAYEQTALSHVRAYANTFSEVCVAYTEAEGGHCSPRVVEEARKFKPYAEIIQRMAKALTPTAAVEDEDEGYFYSPSLAYNAALLNALIPDERPQTIENLVAELAFAVGTDEARNQARTDYYLDSVADVSGVIPLLTRGEPRTFWDLPQFSLLKEALEKAQLNSASRFATATRDPISQLEMAAYLAVPVATIRRLHDFASLGLIHESLDVPDMLWLLTLIGVESPSQLRAQVDGAKFQALVQRLRREARKDGSQNIDGVRSPDLWASALGRSSS